MSAINFLLCFTFINACALFFEDIFTNFTLFLVFSLFYHSNSSRWIEICVEPKGKMSISSRWLFLCSRKGGSRQSILALCWLYIEKAMPCQNSHMWRSNCTKYSTLPWTMQDEKYHLCWRRWQRSKTRCHNDWLDFNFCSNIVCLNKLILFISLFLSDQIKNKETEYTIHLSPD